MPPLAATGFNNPNHLKKDDLKESRNMNKENLMVIVGKAKTNLMTAMQQRNTKKRAAATHNLKYLVAMADPFVYRFTYLQALADIAETCGHKDIARDIDAFMGISGNRK